MASCGHVMVTDGAEFAVIRHHACSLSSSENLAIMREFDIFRQYPKRAVSTFQAGCREFESRPPLQEANQAEQVQALIGMMSGSAWELAGGTDDDMATRK